MLFRSTRPRTRKDDALEQLRNRRDANKRDRATKQTTVRSSRRSFSSDYDAPGGRDDEFEEKHDELDRPPTLREYNRVRISRGNAMQEWDNSRWPDTVKGCYARIIDHDRTNSTSGENVYRVVLIDGTYSPLSCMACLNIHGA